MNNVLEEAKKNAAKNLKKVQEEADKLRVRFSETKVPDTRIIPSPMRIFTIAVEAEEYKTESGIIVPQNFNSGLREGEAKSQTRYLIVSLGDVVKEQTFDGKKPEVGDELIYMDIPDAVKLSLPVVRDLELLERTNEMLEYTLFDVMEIAGIIKRKEKEKKEKNS